MEDYLGVEDGYMVAVVMTMTMVNVNQTKSTKKFSQIECTKCS